MVTMLGHKTETTFYQGSMYYYNMRGRFVMTDFYKKTSQNENIKTYSEIFSQVSVVKFHGSFGVKSLASVRQNADNILLNITGGF